MPENGSRPLQAALSVTPVVDDDTGKEPAWMSKAGNIHAGRGSEVVESGVVLEAMTKVPDGLTLTIIPFIVGGWTVGRNCCTCYKEMR